MIPRLLSRLRRRRPRPLAPDGGGDGGRRDVFPAKAPDAVPPVDRGAIVAALGMADGEPASEVLIAAIAAETHARRACAGLLDGPASPVATGLRIRRAGVPDWWQAGGNLLLCGEDVGPVDLTMNFMRDAGQGSIVIVGSKATAPRISVNGGPALIVLGDRAWLNGGGISTQGPSSVLIGEDTTCTWLPSVSSFNGGMVLVGADGMWAPGVNFMTDDGHAVVEAASGRRINRYGGRIVVDRHVWLGFHVALSADCYVGENSVVGQGSLVKNARLPADAICTGRPARAVRTGTNWTREDIPA